MLNNDISKSFTFGIKTLEAKIRDYVNHLIRWPHFMSLQSMPKESKI